MLKADSVVRILVYEVASLFFKNILTILIQAEVLLIHSFDKVRGKMHTLSDNIIGFVIKKVIVNLIHIDKSIASKTNELYLS